MQKVGTHKVSRRMRPRSIISTRGGNGGQWGQGGVWKGHKGGFGGGDDLKMHFSTYSPMMH